MCWNLDWKCVVVRIYLDGVKKVSFQVNIDRSGDKFLAVDSFGVEIYLGNYVVLEENLAGK